MNIEALTTYLTERGSDLAIAIVAAAIIVVVGRFVSKALAGLTRKIAVSRFDDQSLGKFLGSLVSVLVMTFFLIAAIARLGIQTTSFIAVLGAAGLAVGMALQGSLSNFASGVLLLIFRPIAVGEVAEVAGTTGKVEEIGIFTTTLLTPDNKVVIIANSGVTGSNITNYSRMETRRVDIVFGIGYDDDIRKAKELLMDEMKRCEQVLDEPAPFVGVLELADSSVNLVARPWAATTDYWDVYFHLMESVKYRFDAEGISIPYPQSDVHMHDTSAA